MTPAACVHMYAVLLQSLLCLNLCVVSMTWAWHLVMMAEELYV